MAMTALLRPARSDELQRLYDVWYRAETHDNPHPPAPGEPPMYLAHVLATGILVVAEEAGEIRGFAGAITRGNVAFLTDLFVDPAYQSGGLGKTLLDAALPPTSGLTRCTLSSSDPRALALYIRAGMQPQWTSFALRLETAVQRMPQAAQDALNDVEIRLADADDPALGAWDSRISGRPRAAERTFWTHEQHAIPLWLLRRDQVIGYAYVRLDVGSLRDPHACMVGPVGANTPDDAATCALATVHWVAQRAAVLHMDVPGPHACLPLLLERGFRILYADTFVASASAPLFDARCYIPSGSDLF
ncbi:MAG: GNAT family N-acetyltransferase [Ktedonobacterales bacterium]